MWLKLQEIIFICFFEKINFEKICVSLSHDNNSKKYRIVLKFGTDVAFIYLQIEFVGQNNRSIRKKDN